MEYFEIPFGAKDSELQEWEYTIPEGFTATIEDGKMVIKRKESEDERIINQLISLVRSAGEVLLIPTNKEELITWLEKQKEQEPVDKFQEYLNASPAERRKMNMDEILGDNKGHQKTPDALTTDSNKEDDTSDCKYKNLDDIAQEYVDGIRQYNPEPTWDLIQTAVCYGYHLAENGQKPAEWSEEDENMAYFINQFLEYHEASDPTAKSCKDWFKNKLKSLRPSWKPSEEQMEALESAVKLYKDTHFEIHHEKIVSLYEQLKKLM